MLFNGSSKLLDSLDTVACEQVNSVYSIHSRHELQVEVHIHLIRHIFHIKFILRSSFRPLWFPAICSIAPYHWNLFAIKKNSISSKCDFYNFTLTLDSSNKRKNENVNSYSCFLDCMNLDLNAWKHQQHHFHKIIGHLSKLWSFCLSFYLRSTWIHNRTWATLKNTNIIQLKLWMCIHFPNGEPNQLILLIYYIKVHPLYSLPRPRQSNRILEKTSNMCVNWTNGSGSFSQVQLIRKKLLLFIFCKFPWVWSTWSMTNLACFQKVNCILYIYSYTFWKWC